MDPILMQPILLPLRLLTQEMSSRTSLIIPSQMETRQISQQLQLPLLVRTMALRLLMILTPLMKGQPFLEVRGQAMTLIAMTLTLTILHRH